MDAFASASSVQLWWDQRRRMFPFTPHTIFRSASSRAVFL